MHPLTLTITPPPHTHTHTHKYMGCVIQRYRPYKMPGEALEKLGLNNSNKMRNIIFCVCLICNTAMSVLVKSKHACIMCKNAIAQARYARCSVHGPVWWIHTSNKVPSYDTWEWQQIFTLIKESTIYSTPGDSRMRHTVCGYNSLNVDPQYT